MEIRLGSSQKRHEYDIGSRLPLALSQGASKGEGIFLTGFGGLFAAFPLFAGFIAAQSDEALGLAPYVMVAVFCLAGIGIMLLGLSAFMRRVEISVNRDFVKGSRRGAFGTRAWHDPITAYQGVLGYSRQHSRGKNRGSYTVYYIRLKHGSESHRDVDLWSSLSSGSHRERTEDFARMLRRPVLVGEENGPYEVRELADLDKSVADLVAEGKLENDFDAAVPPPGGKLVVETLADGYRFETGFRAPGYVVMATAFCVIGVGLVYWYFGPGITGGEGSPWVVPVVGLVFSGFGAWMMSMVLFGRAFLEVTPDGVTLWQTVPGASDKRRTMAGEIIEEIRVSREKNGWVALTLTSDVSAETFGEYGLDRRALEYVRGAVLSVLASSRR